PSSGIELNTILPAFTIQQIAISPDNTHVYVTMGTSGTQEVVFAAGNSVPFGTSVNIPVKKIGGAALSAAVDPQNRLLYIGETAATSGSNSGGLRVLDYNTLIELSGSPFASGGLAPYSILPMSSGNIVYIANRNVSGSSTGNITGFTIASSGTTYSLTPLSTTASTGTAPVDMAVESTGTYLLVVNSGGGPDLNAYTFDSTTIGKLDSALTSSTGTDPVQASAIAALPK
ncbi:MAG: beta-propeller fold lactonase family protein, partial [Acidobacteriota bacterium]|nr:beta-propeller fold lactonase family protein [Acidobacteriota bacterium]